MADAVYTEVLQIDVDVTSFQAGLAALESAYEEFVDRVNTKGLGAGNIINVGGIADLKAQIGELQTYVQSFDAALVRSMDDMDSGLSNASAKIAESLKELQTAKDEASKP